MNECKGKPNNKISLTRGDTLPLEVGIQIDEAVYTPQEGDTVRFAVKHATYIKDRQGYTEFKDETPIILKNIPIDTMTFQIDPADTKDLGFGDYKYDCEITFADGTVATFIKDEDFVITPEVH